MKVKVEVQAPPPAKPPWRSVVITFETPERDDSWAVHRNLARSIGAKLKLPKSRVRHQYWCVSFRQPVEKRISIVRLYIYRGDAPTEDEKLLFKEALQLARSLSEKDLKQASSAEALPRLPWS